VRPGERLATVEEFAGKELMDIMPGFTLADIETSGARIRLRHDGDGPPLLLLHGNPLTHVSWHAVAPRLAERFHVVAADLRGYGDSSAPPEEPDSSNYIIPSGRWRRTRSR
jgi:haloacetate dehalogenase